MYVSIQYSMYMYLYEYVSYHVYICTIHVLVIIPCTYKCCVSMTVITTVIYSYHSFSYML